MKREYKESSAGAGASAGTGGVTGKAKMWQEEELPPAVAAPQQDAGVDELLAVLGYKVRNSDMAEVAQKLEQLEMMMGSAQEDELLSHLTSSDTVHYNPSDLASWLQSMLTEVNNPPPNFVDDADLAPVHSLPPQRCFDGAENPVFVSSAQSSAINVDISNNNSSSSGIFDEDLSSDYDLRAIPGGAICGRKRENKRMKPTYESPPSSLPSSSSSSSSCSSLVRLPAESARPVLILDSQENGIRLVHTLILCAEAVQNGNMKLAEALVKQIGLLAVSQAGAMKKVATYFAEALARRIYRLYPQDSFDSFSDILEMHFYESCPYLKFAHFTASQAILEAFEGKSRVHVIDFSMKQGMQWPALMQALALRPGGPPAFRLTGIGPPQPDNTDALKQVGLKLAQLAETIHIEFEYRGFVANSLADLDAAILDIRPSEVEAVAVNSVFELHKLLSRPGAIEKVLKSITAMKPRIVTVVEQEANHNGPVFLERFNEALHYYSTMFDSLEGSAVPAMSGVAADDQVMSEAYLGRQICNVVACEGPDRVERHESLAQWRIRMESAGFAPVHLGSNAFKQASMLLSLFGGVDGYRVEENEGCLMLGWHTRPLIATSAWRPAGDVSV